MSTAGATLAGVGRIDIDYHTASPGLFVFQEETEVPPSLVQNRFVEADLLPDLPTWRFNCVFAAARHVFDLQCFEHDSSVVFADISTELVKKVVPHVCNPDMKHGDTVLLLKRFDLDVSFKTTLYLLARKDHYFSPEICLL